MPSVMFATVFIFYKYKGHDYKKKKMFNFVKISLIRLTI